MASTTSSKRNVPASTPPRWAAPGIYFRVLLIGDFEGIDPDRGIAWRAADSLALRDFLGLDLHDVPSPAHVDWFDYLVVKTHFCHGLLGGTAG